MKERRQNRDPRTGEFLLTNVPLVNGRVELTTIRRYRETPKYTSYLTLEEYLENRRETVELTPKQYLGKKQQENPHLSLRLKTVFDSQKKRRKDVIAIYARPRR